ncbi:MAG: hypothetical protein ABIB97_06270 [Patescibacteria group bacterium]
MAFFKTRPKVIIICLAVATISLLVVSFSMGQQEVSAICEYAGCSINPCSCPSAGCPGCGGGESCCDPANLLNCTDNPGDHGDYICVDSDSTDPGDNYAPSQISACTADMGFGMIGCWECWWDNDICGITEDCQNYMREPCSNRDNWPAYAQFEYSNNAIINQQSLAVPDVLSPAEDRGYVPGFAPKKYINWTVFPTIRFLFEMTGDSAAPIAPAPGEPGKRDTRREPINIPYGDAATTELCGDDYNNSGTAYPEIGRTEWYAECLPYFDQSGFGYWAGDQQGAVCSDGNGADIESYACCNMGSDCVFNVGGTYTCFASALSKLQFRPGSSWYHTYSETERDKVRIDTNDLSTDYEICASGWWTEQDYLEQACSWAENDWLIDDAYCEPADRGWGANGTCRDNNQQYGYYGGGSADSFDDYCCGDDPNEYKKCEGIECGCCATSTSSYDADTDSCDSVICNPSGQTNYYEVKNSAGNTVARFGDKGFVEIASDANFRNTTAYDITDPPGDAFIVKDSSDRIIFYIDANGHLEARGNKFEYASTAGLESVVLGLDAFAIQVEEGATNNYYSAVGPGGNLFMVGCLKTGVTF